MVECCPKRVSAALVDLHFKLQQRANEIVGFGLLVILSLIFLFAASSPIHACDNQRFVSINLAIPV